MKHTKKLLALLMTVLLLSLTATLCAPVASASVLDGGQIQSSNLTWSLDSDGTLTISGRGQMPDLEYYYIDFPWRSYSTTIKTVVIENGVTIIERNAFESCKSLTKLYIPSSVISIYQDACIWCESLSDIYYEGTQSEWEANDFSAGFEETYGLPSNISVHYNSTMPLVSPYDEDEESEDKGVYTYESENVDFSKQQDTPKATTSGFVILFIIIQLLFDVVVVILLIKGGFLPKKKEKTTRPSTDAVPQIFPAARELFEDTAPAQRPVQQEPTLARPYPTQTAWQPQNDR